MEVHESEGLVGFGFIAYIAEMIVWVNGTFGAGKTTTAARLAEMWKGSRRFDPEQVGYALGNNLKDIPFSDFQDLPPWRLLVVENLDRISAFTGQDIIAIQTVLREDYWNEISSGLEARGQRVFHVVLECSDVLLTDRINNDQIDVGAREWRLAHIADYERARPWMIESADLVIDTGSRTPEQVARQILNSIATSSGA